MEQVCSHCHTPNNAVIEKIVERPEHAWQSKQKVDQPLRYTDSI